MLSGIARLTSVNRKNERVLLEVLGPGDVVCIPTLLPDLRHSLECEAFTECEIGVLSAQALVETAGLQYAKFLLALKLTMGRWWTLLVRQSRFVDQTLEERIAVALGLISPTSLACPTPAARSSTCASAIATSRNW